MHLREIIYHWRPVSLGLLTIVGLLSARFASTKVGLPTNAAQTNQHSDAGTVKVGSVSGVTSTRFQDSILRANPLWAIPLSALSATRGRPVFSQTRRSHSPMRPDSVVPSVANHPPFTLLGAIAGQDEGVAILLDDRTKRMIRLKTGQQRLGWMLRGVKRREATLQNGNTAAILKLPSPPANKIRRK
jgi:general secretion pathway protein N